MGLDNCGERLSLRGDKYHEDQQHCLREFSEGGGASVGPGRRVGFRALGGGRRIQDRARGGCTSGQQRGEWSDWSNWKDLIWAESQQEPGAGQQPGNKRLGQNEQALLLRTPCTRVSGDLYRMFTAASFVIVTNWTQPNCPSSIDWINSDEFRQWKTLYATILKIAEFKPHTSMRINLKNTIFDSVWENSELYTYDLCILCMNFIFQYNLNIYIFG